MKSKILAIARYTVIEGLRTRLLEATALGALMILAGSLFVHQLAVIESSRMQIATYAATMRLAAVFIAAFHVISSIAREFNDKGIDVALAVDLPRSHYILGKLAGYIALITLLAILACAPLTVVAGPAPALFWGISLLLELTLVAALAMFCVITFTNMVPAAGFVLAFYLLGRSLTALRLISEHPVSGLDTVQQQLIAGSLKALSWLMPALDAWTRTTWLLETRLSWPDLGAVASQAFVYLVLLFAATLVDFYRRNF
jgi:ABC-type transport system involved in multi-copper enzyme maturation permease subunit